MKAREEENKKNTLPPPTKRKYPFRENKPTLFKGSMFYSTDPFDLHSLLEEVKHREVPDEVVVIGISRAKDILFREIKNVNPTGEAFSYGDDIVVRNKVTSNINIFSRIMERLTHKCKSPRTIQVCFSEGDLLSLFSLLKSEDEVERRSVRETIKNVYKKRVHRKEIEKYIENEFQMFNLGLRTHIGIESVLEIFYYTQCVDSSKDINSEDSSRDSSKDINSEDSSRDSSKDSSKDNNSKDKSLEFNLDNNTKDNNTNSNTKYLEIILLFIRKCQLEHIDNFKDIVLGLCKENLRRSQLTLKFIFYSFEGVSFLGRVVLVEIVVGLFVVWGEEVKEFVRDLSTLVNSSLSSSHHVLLEEVIGIFEVKEIYTAVEKEVEDFLPRIFDVLYGLSKKYWRKKGKGKVFRNISLILNMSHKVFEECLVEYNRKRYKEREDVKDVKEEMVGVVEKCLEYSEIEKKNEEKYNKRLRKE